ncbi:MAG: alpha,alpha-phosphotrehalase, partial [Kluyvera sp.]
WCYRRQWQGQTLLVVANLNAEPLAWEPPSDNQHGQRLMSNYDDAPQTPTKMTLRPFEAIWWLQG